MKKVGRFIHEYGEGIFIAVLILFSAAMFINAFSIVGLSSATDVVGPSLMPKLIFGLMSTLSVLLAVDYVIRKRALGSAVDDSDSARVARSRGLISIGGIVAFVFLMDKLGFLISSTLYLIFEFFMLGPKEKRRPLLWTAMAAVFCVIVYYLFRYQVYVKLPKGILG